MVQNNLTATALTEHNQNSDSAFIVRQNIIPGRVHPRRKDQTAFPERGSQPTCKGEGRLNALTLPNGLLRFAVQGCFPAVRRSSQSKGSPGARPWRGKLTSGSKVWRTPGVIHEAEWSALPANRAHTLDILKAPARFPSTANDQPGGDTGVLKGSRPGTTEN